MTDFSNDRYQTENATEKNKNMPGPSERGHFKCERCLWYFQLSQKHTCKAPSENIDKPIKSLDEKEGNTVDKCEKTGLISNLKSETTIKEEHLQDTFINVADKTCSHDVFRHVAVHTKDDIYECQYCSKKFIGIEGYSKHVRMQHQQTKTADIKTVAKVDTDNATYNENEKTGNASKDIHFVKRTGKMVTCDVCGKVWKSLSHLKAHMVVHTGLKPFRCQICYLDFKWGSTYRQHMKKEHPGIEYTTRKMKLSDTKEGLNIASQDDINLKRKNDDKISADTDLKTKKYKGVQINNSGDWQQFDDKKDGIYADETKDGMYADGTKDGLYADGTKDGTDGTTDGTDGTKDGVYADGTKDGTDGTKDGLHADGTKDGTDGTKDGTDGTKDGVYADGTKDGTDGTKDGMYADGTKDGMYADGTKYGIYADGTQGFEFETQAFELGDSDEFEFKDAYVQSANTRANSSKDATNIDTKTVIDLTLNDNPLYEDLKTLRTVLPNADTNEMYASLEANFDNPNRVQIVILNELAKSDIQDSVPVVAHETFKYLGKGKADLAVKDKIKKELKKSKEVPADIDSIFVDDKLDNLSNINMELLEHKKTCPKVKETLRNKKGKNLKMKNGYNKKVLENHKHLLAPADAEGETEQKQSIVTVSLSPMLCEACADQRSKSSLVQCCDSHLVCTHCVEKAAKAVLVGDQQGYVNCPVVRCSSSVPQSELKKSLPSMVLDLLEEKWEKENLDALKNMNDAVTCPHCEFVALLDLNIKKFRCSKCKKSSCRHCQMKWHPRDHDLCIKTTAKMSAIQIPSHWTDSEGCALVDLDNTSDEFEEISVFFINSMGNLRCNVQKIYRVQNRRLWEKYLLLRTHMVADLGELHINEQRLFHGTCKNVIHHICKEGFDWRLSGKHGHSFGQGSYFAKHASYSDNYSARNQKGQVTDALLSGGVPTKGFLLGGLVIISKSKTGVGTNPSSSVGAVDHIPQRVTGSNVSMTVGPTPGPSSAQQDPFSDDRIYCKFMFIGRVLVGQSCRGHNKMKRPEKDSLDPDGRMFHSAVDDVNSPSIFVIFESAQCYPEYLIQYS